MVDAVSKSLNLNMEYLTLLLVFLLGSIAGLVGFSNIIAWLFKKFKDQVLALLTGFILGSLLIIWPWKEKAENGLIESWHLPQNLDALTILSIFLIFTGIFSVTLLEYYSKKTIR
jgi:putative membrane protein